MSSDHAPLASRTDDEPEQGQHNDRQDLLEFAEFLGMDEEAEQLRGDMRTERILRRLKRALNLAGLPISTGAGVPGVWVSPALPAPAGDVFPVGSVLVTWNEGPDLDAMIETAAPDSPPDILCQAVTGAMDKALDSILQAAGLRTIVDSLHGCLVVADTVGIAGADELDL